MSYPIRTYCGIILQKNTVPRFGFKQITGEFYGLSKMITFAKKVVVGFLKDNFLPGGNYRYDYRVD